MKKKIFYSILALLAITTIINIYKGSDKIPEIPIKENDKRNEKYTVSQENIEKKPMFNMNEPVEFSGMIFTINSATISKKIDKLPKIDDMQNILAVPQKREPGKSFDKNLTFIDNNNYLQLDITWENPTTQDREFYLNNNKIHSTEEIHNKYLSLEAQLTTTTIDHTKKNTFAYTLKAKEKVHFYLGYIITDQEARDFMDTMFFCLNINGTPFSYDDKDRKAIRLNID